MPTPRVCVLRAPGTNCDVETAYAFERCGAVAENLHLNRLLEAPQRLRDFQILCIPGGFSYGDDVGAGVIFGSQLRNQMGAEIGEFLTKPDRLVLGICNGFQVLVKAGILPGGAAQWPPSVEKPRTATLTWNDNGRYTARWVHLATADSPSVFLRGIDRVEMPIAHAEGKVVPASEEVLADWQRNRQIALCYAMPGGSATTVPLPGDHNPNGSIANIAGLCDPSGRVLGLMPHPERYQFATQHPQWTRRRLTSDEGEGLKIFRNAVTYFASL
jgi:phosphoribosylformylglycinamidine synthase I